MEQPTNIITIVFVSAIMILTVILYYRKKTYIPGVATTLGVLGTFTGIFFGLLRFDPLHIKESVPALLGGLKLAFITSIAGMSIAILYRLKEGISSSPELSQDATLDTVVNKLDDGFRESKEEVTKVVSALTGDGESTLSTQMQKLRVAFSDKQDELKTMVKDKQDELIVEFKEFAEKMAENNSKALIDALTEVMRDFNSRINEQFGENFSNRSQFLVNNLSDRSIPSL